MKAKTKRASDFFEPVQSLESAIEVLGGSLNLSDFADDVPERYQQEFLDIFTRITPTMFALHETMPPGDDRKTVHPGYDERAVEKRRKEIERIVEAFGDPVEEIDLRHGMIVKFESMYNFYKAIRYLDENLAGGWQQLLALPDPLQRHLNTYLDFSLEEIKRISDQIKQEMALA
jgi:hypothetical protein